MDAAAAAVEGHTERSILVDSMRQVPGPDPRR